MRMIARLLSEKLEPSTQSVLLLGPRQTGKSTLMRSLAPVLEINLMHQATYLAFASNPFELEERLPPNGLIFIDEVQRLPSLLNTIQTLIDGNNHYRFLLTGSSARKLRRGHANLLPGRVLTYQLGPIIAAECNYALDTMKVLSIGTLPGILTHDSSSVAQKLLRSYSATYVAEEIQAESLSRNLEGFARFLKIIAQWSGRTIDLSKIASAAQVERTSVVRWVEVLEDTLVAHRVESFSNQVSKRLVKHPRIFFFDPGVLNGLLGNFTPSADRIGALFEHVVFSQLWYGALARDEELSLSTYRTEGGVEVDFIVEWQGKRWAIEVKASGHIGNEDLSGLKNFREYARPYKSQVWYLGKVAKQIDGISVLPWQMGLKEMGL